MAKRFFCCSGTRKRKIYEPFFTEEGARQLRVVGEDDIFDFIQSFRDSCDMQTILKRFQLGDTSALNCNRGVYGNFVNTPSTLAEFLNAQIKAKQIFDKLSPDVKLSFNNDVNQFFVKMGTPEFNEIVSKFIVTKEDSVNES